MLKIDSANRVPVLTLPDVIANELRAGIVRGDIAPGAALRQCEIAAQFNTSSIPVREAFRRLQAEGLVEVHSNKGAMVSMLSSDDARELFEIRLLLEPPALRLALPHHSKDTLDSARAILDELSADAKPNPLGDANREFHLALYTPAGRPILLDLIAGLYRKTDRYGRKTQGLAAQQARAQTEHRQILGACEDEDIELAVSLLIEHITLFGQELVELLDGSEHS